MFKDAIDQIEDEEYIDSLHEKIELLEKQKEICRETLEFYASENSYKNGMLGQAVLLDGGRQAEKTLEALK